MAGSQSGAGEDQATQVFPTEGAAHQGPTQGVPQHPAPPAPLSPAAGAMPPSPVAGIVRYGPGIPVELPVSQGGRTAEHVWSGGAPPAAPPRAAPLGRVVGLALTV